MKAKEKEIEMSRRRKRQNQGYSVREKKAFKKGMHFGWNKHKKMIRDLRTGKRQLKKIPRRKKLGDVFKQINEIGV